MKARYNARILEAMGLAAKARTELTRQATLEEKQIMSVAREQMEGLLDKARHDIAAEKARAIESLRTEAEQFGAGIAEQVLGRKI